MLGPLFAGKGARPHAVESAAPQGAVADKTMPPAFDSLPLRGEIAQPLGLDLASRACFSCLFQMTRRTGGNDTYEMLVCGAGPF